MGIKIDFQNEKMNMYTWGYIVAEGGVWTEGRMLAAVATPAGPMPALPLAPMVPFVCNWYANFFPNTSHSSFVFKQRQPMALQVPGAVGGYLFRPWSLQALSPGAQSSPHIGTSSPLLEDMQSHWLSLTICDWSMQSLQNNSQNAMIQSRMYYLLSMNALNSSRVLSNINFNVFYDAVHRRHWWLEIQVGVTWKMIKAWKINLVKNCNIFNTHL